MKLSILLPAAFALLTAALPHSPTSERGVKPSQYATPNPHIDIGPSVPAKPLPPLTGLENSTSIPAKPVSVDGNVIDGGPIKFYYNILFDDRNGYEQIGDPQFFNACLQTSSPKTRSISYEAGKSIRCDVFPVQECNYDILHWSFRTEEVKAGGWKDLPIVVDHKIRAYKCVWG